MDEKIRNVNKETKALKWTQVFAASAATLGSFGCGTALAWTAPALRFIDNTQCGNGGDQPDCDIPNVGKEAASWIGALMPIGAVIAGPVTGFLLPRIGRKKTMMSYAIPFAIGTLLYVLAHEVSNAVPIYMGRILTGFAGGAFALAAPLYIMELAEPTMRGALASLMQMMSNLGVAFVDALSIKDALYWHEISAVCVVIPVLMLILLFLVPESPYYLLVKGDEKGAMRSLEWFRGPKYDCNSELEEKKKVLEEQKQIGSITFKELLTRREYFFPFCIALSLMFMQQFSGVNAVIFYAQTIFLDAEIKMDPGLSSFLVAAAQVFGTGVAILVVDKFGRKILLILSDLLMCISIFCLGVFFYLKEHSEETCDNGQNNSTVLFSDASVFAQCIPHDGKYSEEFIRSLGWLPLVSLIVYIIFFSIGFGPLPWTVNAEIFPTEAKSLGSSIAFCFNWFCAFIVTKFEPNLEDLINPSGSYFVFSAICGLGTIFIILFVPETKGKSPEELREMFAERQHNNIN